MASEVSSGQDHSKAQDAKWMAAAARYAARARTLSNPNPNVACLIVRDGRLMARGVTQAGGRPHAEAFALQALAHSRKSAEGTSIYVTLEPCAHKSPRGPSCADLLALAKPARIIIGQNDPDPRTSGQGAERLSAAGIAVVQLDDINARASLSGYFIQQTKDRPFVTLKLAMSADGFIARMPGKDQWITGPISRAHVHARRAMSDAILVGGGTLRADNPRLDVRLAGIENRAPERFILTSGKTPHGVKAIASPQDIHSMPNVHYLYVEGGGATAASFLQAGLVDRIELYTAPITIGQGTKAPKELHNDALASASWRKVETCQLGSETFTAYHHFTI